MGQGGAGQGTITRWERGAGRGRLMVWERMTGQGTVASWEHVLGRAGQEGMEGARVCGGAGCPGGSRHAWLRMDAAGVCAGLADAPLLGGARHPGRRQRGRGASWSSTGGQASTT